MPSTNDTIQTALQTLKSLSGLELSLSPSAENAEETLAKLHKLIGQVQGEYSAEEVLRHLLFQTKPYEALQPCLARLGIRDNKEVCLFLIHTAAPFDEMAANILRQLFPVGKNHILPVDERSILLIHRYKQDSIQDLAHTIADTLHTEAMSRVVVVYSEPVKQLSMLHGTYKDMLQCLEIAGIFHPDQYVFAGTKLGIGGLLYDLPPRSCLRFLKEILGKEAGLPLDEEHIQVINTFISHNLSIAETARRLYMHRNTLVYKIEQAEQKTGLDIRSFEGAMHFRLASLIGNYLKAKESL